MKMDAAQRQLAVETLSHQVAACVHTMLAVSRTTVADLKAKLDSLSPGEHSYVDAILSASNPHSIKLNHLADIAHVLGFEWDVRIERIIENALPPPPSEEEEKT